MITTIFGYLVVVEFFFLEGRIRQGQQARSLDAGEFDQRSTIYIGLAISAAVIALLASWLLNGINTGSLPDGVGWYGVALAVCGLLLRWWANRVLGAFYTRTLTVTDNQTIVRNGPYRLIRHPGYMGSILMWTGAALATDNWFVVVFVLILMAIVYMYRIEHEEAMLASQNPAYQDYQLHTWKLIPLIY